MFKFEVRDEGFFVLNATGHAIAHVDAVDVTFDNNPELRAPKRVETIRPKEKWEIHYTSHKLTPQDNEVFLDELLAQDWAAMKEKVKQSHLATFARKAGKAA